MFVLMFLRPWIDDGSGVSGRGLPEESKSNFVLIDGERALSSDNT
jgi:hypothetical protein